MYHCMLITLAWDGSGPFHSPRPRWPHFWWFQSIWKRDQWCHIPLQRDRNPLPKTSQDIPRPKIVKPPLCCECETSRKSLVASKQLASNPNSKRSFDTPTVNSLTMSRQAAHIRIQKKHETKNKRKCIIVYPNWYLWKPMAFESAHQGHTVAMDSRHSRHSICNCPPSPAQPLKNPTIDLKRSVPPLGPTLIPVLGCNRQGTMLQSTGVWSSRHPWGRSSLLVNSRFRMTCTVPRV